MHEKTQVHARNLNMNDRLQNYIDKKLDRLDRYLPQITDVRIDLAMEHQKQGGEHAIVQLTLRNQRGVILRAEEKKQADVYAAVDLVIDKMYRQISRYKDKRRRRAGKRFETMEPELAAAEPLPAEFEAVGPEEEARTVVRRKTIDLTPMNEEEAIDQMELLGHDFFVFYNADTGSVNILYRREGGNYGLLQPVLT